MLRQLLVKVHRWAGLCIAAFLVVAGLTGAVISWDHELDGILNPHLIEASGEAFNVDPFAAAARIEKADPRARATYLPLVVEPGHSLSIFVSPRINPKTGDHFELGYNQVFVDPATGRELGRREWGAVWPVTSETLVSFLYVLHYSLHIPEIWGIDDWGLWLMGAVAIVWMLDAFVGFYLTLPVRRPPRPDRAAPVERVLSRGWRVRWAPAWRLKSTGSFYRINFDLHRALGLWTWGLLFLLAFTAFSLSLYREVFYPILSVVSKVTPTPFDTRKGDAHVQIEPVLSFADVAGKAATEAQRRGWVEPAGAIFYSPEIGVYGAKFFQPGGDHGAAGVGPPEIYFDAIDGRVLGERLPWTGTVADIFVQAQFPLHSGRILGLPGRVLISVMGVVVAVVSITGVVIFARKRRARLAAGSALPAVEILKRIDWKKYYAWGIRAGGALLALAQRAMPFVHRGIHAVRTAATPIVSVLMMQILSYLAWGWLTALEFQAAARSRYLK